MAKENSTNNSLSHGGGDPLPEESGWTLYFEDFLHTNSFSSSPLSPDQSYSVTDAASSVADHKLLGDAVDRGWSSSKDINMNFFKKRKMIKELYVEDEALEDTASSPVNSPKVSDDSTYFSRNQKHKENLISTPQVNERREMDFVGIGSDDYTELKKRGLCLVPLSMVVNYLAD